MVLPSRARALDREPEGIGVDVRTREAQRMRAFGRIIVEALMLAGLMALPATAQGPDCIVIDDFSTGTVGQSLAADLAGARQLILAQTLRQARRRPRRCI